MTMTDAAAAAALGAAARARAVAEAREAIAAAQRAARAFEDAAELVVLRGQDAWLGPAREAFDARCEALRVQLALQTHELRMLAGTIEGAL